MIGAISLVYTELNRSDLILFPLVWWWSGAVLARWRAVVQLKGWWDREGGYEFTSIPLVLLVALRGTLRARNETRKGYEQRSGLL